MNKWRLMSYGGLSWEKIRDMFGACLTLDLGRDLYNPVYCVKSSNAVQLENETGSSSQATCVRQKYMKSFCSKLIFDKKLIK